MSKGKITLIGVGRLGICTALVFEKAGYEVLGIDINAPAVEQMNNRTFHSFEPDVDEWLKACKNFTCTTEFSQASTFSELIFICVDTPSTPDGFYDTFKLERVLTALNEQRLQNKHVMIMCTVLPGFIRNQGRAILKDCTNTTLNYNPEFIAQGAILWGFLNPDVVLIGAETEAAGQKIQAIYQNSCANQPYYAIMNPESAEVMKISLNCFITTKIAYANMIGDLADMTPGADKVHILEAIGHDSRVGTKCLKPGWSYGGPCFPRDNRALFGYADKLGFDAKISKATEAMNQDHIKVTADQYLAMNKETYVFANIAYKDKCRVPITEESAKLMVAVRLVEAGKKVILRDEPQILEDAKRVFGHEDKFIYEDSTTVPRDEKTFDA